LERKTVRSIKEGHFIVPLGVGAALRSWRIDGNRISELGWNDAFEENGFKIIAEEGVHYSNRSPWNRNMTLWNSYVIQTPNIQIFWGGDTGYGEHFAKIGGEYDSFTEG
jgi:L-ascorbate metabolism protein UlaG (beta-lactamase superfamily)